ncbi:hypothetical protein BaRGS_00014543 [Batillaria attramentaria]|uniref:Uncharacterized protein n=1 Tax=Batillaria attramentaria TaxID=370345 RepID=A0ABD0L429_9CAEN
MSTLRGAAHDTITGSCRLSNGTYNLTDREGDDPSTYEVVGICPRRLQAVMELILSNDGSVQVCYSPRLSGFPISAGGLVSSTLCTAPCGVEV